MIFNYTLFHLQGHICLLQGHKVCQKHAYYNACFKLPLVKKRWDIFITCQQKMGHLSGTRVSTKSIHNYSKNMCFSYYALRCSLWCKMNNITPFKLRLVKKRWNIFITCQQKMRHLSGTRVSTKSILKYPNYDQN